MMRAAGSGVSEPGRATGGMHRRGPRSGPPRGRLAAGEVRQRLLFTSGVIDRPGSVDAGTTLTDSLPLERRRGITIKLAVASFPIGDIDANLVDTPGHPDFIAEVDRVLSVLDGVVLVVSAVEGVQPQTRILMRSLERLRMPALLFVNKIDRAGAQPGGVVDEIARRLTGAVIAMGRVDAAGTRGACFVAAVPDDAGFTAGLAELLAERDDGLLAAYLRATRRAFPTLGCGPRWPPRPGEPRCTPCSSARPLPAQASSR